MCYIKIVLLVIIQLNKNQLKIFLKIFQKTIDKQSITWYILIVLIVVIQITFRRLRESTSEKKKEVENHCLRLTIKAENPYMSSCTTT